VQHGHKLNSPLNRLTPQLLQPKADQASCLQGICVNGRGVTGLCNPVCIVCIHSDYV
jgi:hypothetical protein